MNTFLIRMMVSSCLLASISCVASELVPSNIEPVDLTKLEGLWFDVAHFEHPVGDYCDTMTMLNFRRDESDAALSFSVRCKKHGHSRRLEGDYYLSEMHPDQIAMVFDIEELNDEFDTDYYILASSEEPGWVALGYPSRGTLWIWSHTSSLPAGSLLAIRETLSEAGHFSFQELDGLVVVGEVR